MKKTLILLFIAVLITGCTKYKVKQEIEPDGITGNGICHVSVLVTTVYSDNGIAMDWVCHSSYKIWSDIIMPKTIDSIKCVRYKQADSVAKELERIENLKCN